MEGRYDMKDIPLDLTDGFRFDEQFFAWGITITELVMAMPADKLLSTAGRELLCKCDFAYGFAATNAWCLGATVNRPVTRVVFTYEHEPADTFAALHVQLQQHYGTPNEVWENKNIWKVGGVQVQLEAGTGPNWSTRLYLDWLDVDTAARPYTEEYLRLEAALSELVLQPGIIHRFTFAWKQIESGPYTTLATASLNSPNIFATPGALASTLDETTVAVVEGHGGKLWCLSTKWATAIFQRSAELSNPGFEYSLLLPARGGGGTFLDIQTLRLHDEGDSVPMKQLVATIERISGISIPLDTAFDC